MATLHFPRFHRKSCQRRVQMNNHTNMIKKKRNPCTRTRFTQRKIVWHLRPSCNWHRHFTNCKALSLIKWTRMIFLVDDFSHLFRTYFFVTPFRSDEEMAIFINECDLRHIRYVMCQNHSRNQNTRAKFNSIRCVCCFFFIPNFHVIQSCDAKNRFDSSKLMNKFMLMRRCQKYQKSIRKWAERRQKFTTFKWKSVSVFRSTDTLKLLKICWMFVNKIRICVVDTSYAGDRARARAQNRSAEEYLLCANWSKIKFELFEHLNFIRNDIVDSIRIKTITKQLFDWNKWFRFAEKFTFATILPLANVRFQPIYANSQVTQSI